MDGQRKILQAFRLEVVPFVLQLGKLLLRNILLAAFSEVSKEIVQIQIAYIVIGRGEEAVDREMTECFVSRKFIVGKDRVDRVDLLLCERDVGLQDAFQRFLMRRFRVFAPGRQQPVAVTVSSRARTTQRTLVRCFLVRKTMRSLTGGPARLSAAVLRGACARMARA